MFLSLPFIFLILISLAQARSSSPAFPPMGNYAITTDLSRKAILWNLKTTTKKILDRTANIYSAYFIKNSDNLMWQHDSDNEVIIENTEGKIIKRFNPGFPTYGEVMTSNLKTYIASDEAWNLDEIAFENNSAGFKTILKKVCFARISRRTEINEFKFFLLMSNIYYRADLLIIMILCQRDKHSFG